jgi:archaeal type IV pilus assembly protein PilA
MTQKRLKDNNEAVSEIIGELLVLFITVAIFGLLIVVVNGMINRPPTDIVSIGAANNTTTVMLTHMGGDNIDYRYISVIVNSNAVPYARSDDNGNELWDIGEILFVTNPPASQSLSILVYDSASSAILGDFRLR